MKRRRYLSYLLLLLFVSQEVHAANPLWRFCQWVMGRSNAKPDEIVQQPPPAPAPRARPPEPPRTENLDSPEDSIDASILSVGMRGPALSMLSLPGSIIGDHTQMIQPVRQNPRDQTQMDQQVRLRPGAPIILGRAQRTLPDYLDPRYGVSNFAPDGQPIGTGNPLLARAQCMLVHHPDGILVVNGIPHRPGHRAGPNDKIVEVEIDGKPVKIRAPLNPVRLVSPEIRAMDPGEVYLIRRGEAAEIRLPSGTTMVLRPQ